VAGTKDDEELLDGLARQIAGARAALIEPAAQMGNQ